MALGSICRPSSKYQKHLYPGVMSDFLTRRNWRRCFFSVTTAVLTCRSEYISFFSCVHVEGVSICVLRSCTGGESPSVGLFFACGLYQLILASLEESVGLKRFQSTQEAVRCSVRLRWEIVLEGACCDASNRHDLVRVT